MCNCIEKVNKLLANEGTNAKVASPELVNGNLEKITLNRAQVLTEKLDTTKRTKLVKITADFCPFCGETY